MCRDFTQKPIYKFRTDYSIGWLGLSWEPSPNASSTSLQQTRNYFVACVITKSISDHRKTLFLSASKRDLFRSDCKSWAATPFLQLHGFFQSLSLNWVQAKKGDFQPILSRAQAPVLIFSEEERQQTWVAQTRASLSIYCCWRQRIFQISLFPVLFESIPTRAATSFYLDLQAGKQSSSHQLVYFE